MPLVIAVIVIIVIFLNAHDSRKKSERDFANREKDRRKTNARMEQGIVDFYMKHGYSFEDAFKNSYNDMIEAGYSPCIPREAYSKNQDGVQSSFCGFGTWFDVEKYDSFWVTQRRNSAKRHWHEEHPDGEELTTAKLDELTYANYPNTVYAYLNDIKRLTNIDQAYPVGSFIIYPSLGTCEILAHNWIQNGVMGGYYTLKVLTTGQIVKYVRIGDKQIRRQGRG